MVAARVNYDTEVPLALLVADEPEPQIGDYVTDRTGQVGKIIRIAPSGFVRVRWLVRMAGAWVETYQASLCARSELAMLW